jgi:alpha,alpha-trehalase
LIRLQVESHFQALLAQEDTDGDRRITVHDRGPRCYEVDGFPVRGTYALSNLLQELALARDSGQSWLELDPQQLTEPPTQRISRGIRERCWTGLTRRLDPPSLSKVLGDPKMAGPVRLYLPANDRRSHDYYADCGVEVVILPAQITPRYVLGINDKPGLLGLALEEEPLPYVVPGGRFNEMYGWDSYFIALGLIHDGHFELALAMLKHQVYQIRHYGQVLNANRSYYLTRSQPPFLTRFLQALLAHRPLPLDFVHEVVRTAMHEYAHVWAGGPRLTPTGLSRYLGQGIGMPPETEPGHYHEVLLPWAARSGLAVEDFERAYLARELTCPELDAYFVHDRTVRESGHDTSYRLEGRAADLCTVDLNSLLYAYEVDLADLLERYGQQPGFPEADIWRGRASRRQALLHELCWDEASGQFFDYDYVQKARTGYQSATGLWPLWAGLATPRQAERAMAAAPLEKGGLAASSLASRGPLGPGRPARQWDYPYGWAPHQLMAWEGLQRYHLDAAAWAERWLRMITRNAIDFNGVIPEKYDVVEASHQVFAEYGNVGADFDYITREGFGWTNASYQIGLEYLSARQRAHLDELTS